MRCDNCHSNQAVRHITVIVDGITDSKDLCLECFELKSTASEKQTLGFIKSALCLFCGNPSNVGGDDPLAAKLGIRRIRHYCLNCADIYNRIVSQISNEGIDISNEIQRRECLDKITLVVDSQVKTALAAR